MIALIDDLEQQTVSKKTNNPETLTGRLRQALANSWADHRKRRADKITIYQLTQLNDALLRDIGLSRYELMSIRNRTLTVDSLTKQTILSNRDNVYSTTSLRK